MEYTHNSVLLNECIEGLKINRDGCYVDGTMGGAGHSLYICKSLSEKGRLIGIDQDDFAINYAKERLKEYNNVTYVRNNFSSIQVILDEIGIDKIDGALLDLGVSSFQLDEGERGFSYMQDAALDMRMDKRKYGSAHEIVNKYSMEKLSEIIYAYGEEKWAKRIAEFIVKERQEKPIDTTFELVSVIKKAIPKKARENGPHPAKRTFQAIRIEVNGELEILKQAVNDITDRLKTGGRLCIITFHSLEDRIIKNAFRTLENPCTCPRDFPVCMCGRKPSGRIITRKPILPSEEEIEENPRARSAKLRIIEKL